MMDSWYYLDSIIYLVGLLLGVVYVCGVILWLVVVVLLRILESTEVRRSGHE